MLHFELLRNLRIISLECWNYSTLDMLQVVLYPGLPCKCSSFGCATKIRLWLYMLISTHPFSLNWNKCERKQQVWKFIWHRCCWSRLIQHVFRSQLPQHREQKSLINCLVATSQRLLSTNKRQGKYLIHVHQKATKIDFEIIEKIQGNTVIKLIYSNWETTVVALPKNANFY